MIIKEVDLQNSNLVRELYELQQASYLIEAKLINFYEIPPLMETIDDLKRVMKPFWVILRGMSLRGQVLLPLMGKNYPYAG